LRSLSTKKLRENCLNQLNDNELEFLKFSWPIWARNKQRPPISDWKTWLLLGGRGAGKTRTGAEWVKGIALADPHFPGNSGGRIALVGTTYDDVRDVMIEGESGLLAVHSRADRPTWISSKRELVWRNGVVGKLFSSADPEGLRGNQFGAAWADEVCKWRGIETTWHMLQFCLRLGTSPRQVVTTTPKPLKLIKDILNEKDTITVRSTTYENAENLAGGFLDYVKNIYEGTSLGRQELSGEIIETSEHALWRREQIETSRLDVAPELIRIVVAVDPPASSGTRAASCGIIAAGIAKDGMCYVLADRTLSKASPQKWAAQTVATYHDLQADMIIAEVNQGGDMVRTVIEAVDSSVPVRPVFASRGKWVRAEPVALLYERGRVKHVGKFAELEDQMCSMEPGGKSNGVSPDRVDALVWAMTELALKKQNNPRVRQA